jgi:flavin reductase (DIM6/NTAB) family NADH-FMN oxidoreductase RutF
MVFAPSSRVRDNTSKHTLENVLEHPEVVINIVNYAMVGQMSLASAEYDKGVNEFIKSGLTPLPSQKVKPPRVGESPAAFECKVNKVIKLGAEGGAGNLVVCEVLLAYFDEKILDEKTTINPYQLDAVARMGAAYYCRAQGEAIFTMPRPGRKNSMGVDQMPERVRQSKVLTGNNLGRLGTVEQLPDAARIAAFLKEPAVADLLERYKNDPSTLELQLHKLAQTYLEQGKTEQAWCVLLQQP